MCYRAPRQRHLRFCIVCHLVSPAELSHELLPTHSCSSLALFLLPVTSYRATPPPFRGPQMAWFLRPCLFSWSYRVLLQFFSCISSLLLSPEWCPQAHVGITLSHILGNQQPAAAKNRIVWTSKLNLSFHIATSTNISTKENKQWCSLKQELFRSFPASQLQNLGSAEEIT